VWENQLKGDEMTNSPMVNGWLRASREEAELRLAREMLIDLLQIRFEIAIPSDVITAIEAQPALSMLKVWHRKAIIVPSMEAFIQVLRQ